MVSIHVLTQSCLLATLSKNLQLELLKRSETEDTILRLEKKILENQEIGEGGQKLNFIPDHLLFDCETGVRMFRATVAPVQVFLIQRER